MNATNTGDTLDDEATRKQRREALDELLSLPLEPYATTVCVTHRRFIPCRTEDGCVLSSEPSDVDAVYAWQSDGT